MKKQRASFISSYGARAALLAFAFLFCMDDAHSSDSAEDNIDFSASSASEAVKQAVDWIQDRRDNRYLPFAIIDKNNSGIFVFDTKSKFLASGPVLLGIARYDRIDPKTLNSSLSKIAADQRVTPSGRYWAILGKDHNGKEMLWIDPEYAIALHPVVDVPGQKRKTRLKTETSKDNRITWGCINVSPVLFETIITPVFKEKGGMIYILPEEPENKGLMQIGDTH